MILIFEKPNVNGTLERTKSAPGEGKSAQNKIEEKKKLGVRACAHAREKTDGLSCLLQMRPFAARFARKNPSSGGRLGRKKREKPHKTAAFDPIFAFVKFFLPSLKFCVMIKKEDNMDDSNDSDPHNKNEKGD